MIPLLLSLLIASSLATADDTKDIKKNPGGWQEFVYYEKGVEVEHVWGYEKHNGKWKIVTFKDEKYTSEEDAKKPIKEKTEKEK